jgi:hypothetical protein
MLNIKEKDLSIIIPFKSGHTLLYSTFIHLFKHLNVEIELEDDPNKILNNVYIFVRNPIDRFFSSYFWIENILKHEEDDIIKHIKKTNIYDIESYINKYDIFLKGCDDFHFIPQSSQILRNNKIYKEEIINSQTNLKLLYDSKLGPNYKIFKIEDIDKSIQNNVLSIIDKEIKFYNKLDKMEFIINKFNFLEDYPNDVSFLFSTFYQYFKNIYAMTYHHMNVDYIKKVSFSDYNKVCSLTENECGFFGYDKKEIDYKLFRKTLI